jgi:hypothetical protein
MSRSLGPPFTVNPTMASGSDWREPASPLEAEAARAIRTCRALYAQARSRPCDFKALDSAEAGREIALNACEELLRSYGHKF